ncbi:MAG: EAL domain-containing protein [Thermodesulfobacteriota bacterium]
MPLIKVNSSDPNIGRPFVFFIRFIGVIFITEFVVMLILQYLDVEESILEYFGDSILLSMISAPLLYLLVIRIFVKRIKVESEKAKTAMANELKANAYADKLALKAYAEKIVQSVPSGLLSVSSDLKVLSANPAFCRMYSLKKNPVGNPISEVSLGHKCNEMILAALGGDPIKAEKVIKHDIDGETRYFRVNVTRIVHDDKAGHDVLFAVEDITRQRVSESKVFSMAYRDSLTGLPNRRLFNNRLRQLIASMKREKLKAVLLFLDVDRFKFVNDSLGHECGDEFLKEIAKRLKGSFRPSDTVARFGGDEFVILLGSIKEDEDILGVVKRLFSAFDAPVSLQGHDLRFNVSMGVSIYPNNGETPEVLLKNADTAMYEAKRAGGNNCKFYASEMSIIGAEWVKMEHKLHRAIANEEFVLHYQPQVNLDTGELIGMEALIRWQEPEAGLISPGRFIPLAEETGLIIPIGKWLLRRACVQAKEWQDKGLNNTRVSVNISMLQFRHDGFLKLVADVLDETGLNPVNLELELTESIIMHDAGETIGRLSELKKLGLRLAIDDFGTGYSSLSYLKSMPIDILKIDQSFVRDITTDKGDEAIVKAIIRLGHNLNIETIAEGVETEQQLRLLKEHFCGNIQGYLISKPVPPAEAEKFLDRSWRLGAKIRAMKVWGSKC